jgi:UDP-N-acetylglucosamine--dolichyl-phosphate N-acetylglucosaminephosphotransferase
MLEASFAFAILAYSCTVRVIPAVSNAFIARGLSGRDLLKPDATPMYVADKRA